jgi:hypothetical protein
MRTTVTLDDDVAVRLDRLQKTRRMSFKTILNEALRAGLDVLQSTKGPRRPAFQTRPMNLGPSLVGSLDNIEEALSRAEGEAHR